MKLSFFYISLVVSNAERDFMSWRHHIIMDTPGNFLTKNICINGSVMWIFKLTTETMPYNIYVLLKLNWLVVLTHWGRVTHICVGKLTIIGSDNGLSPGRRQAIIWTNYGILLIWPLGTNFTEILIEIYTFSFKKMHLKMLSGKCRPFCLGLNVLINRAS